MAKYGGKCQSTTDTYYEALSDRETKGQGLPKQAEGSGVLVVIDERRPVAAPPGQSRGSRFARVKEYRLETNGEQLTQASESYRIQSYRTINRLLAAPETPLLAPPRTIRVLLLPRKDEESKTLTLARFVHVIVEDAKWVLKDPFAEVADE